MKLLAIATMFFLLSPLVTAQETAPTSNDGQPSPSKSVDYETQVRHVFQERCFACHGALKQEGGLRLDTAASAKKGGDSGPAIVASRMEDSLLVGRIEAKDLSTRMPPEGEPLKQDEIRHIRQWIEQGAIAPVDEKPEDDPREHWAFRGPERPPVPLITNQKWVRNPIDAFIAKQHEDVGLTSQPEADRRVWLRRVTVDLIGLPPTMDEANSFLADTSEDAFERVVDRLLASPQYAERWGRHWMDIWRYSDWWGLGAEVRNSQKHIWHWRDWIVESLHEDKPYDQMLREMLAADELYPNDLSRLRASGFLARQYFKFNRTTWLDSTIEHTGKAMLGLTWNCAKCHDHKYDPFSQDEYYQVRAIFEPYQVRTDYVPGILDAEKDGIPRAFDCNLDAATHVHVRGDDRNPDLNRPMAPDVPTFLRFDAFDVQPVKLPPEAVQPGLRAFVLDTAVRQSESKILQATTELDRANAALERLVESQRSPATEHQANTKPEAAALLVDEDFSVERPELWEQRGGKWQFKNGDLIQSEVGSARRSLQLKRTVPRDFEAILRYTPTGGEMWKSVGITFDVNGDSEDKTVYVSSFAGGSKAQVSYRTGGQDAYPPDGAESRPVNLNESHELKIQVRDTLVNVFVDGQRSVSYRLPVARHDGPLEVMTFDVAVTLQHLTLRELPVEEVLQEPSNRPASAAPMSIAEAKLVVLAAEKSLAAAQLEPNVLRAKVAAERARLQKLDDPQTKTLIAAAARSERLLKIAETEAKVAEAELAVQRAPADQKAKLSERLASDTAALQDANKSLSGPLDSFTPLAGSLKTLENNLETEESRRKPFPTTSSGRRSAFANWLTDRRNPLTARVAANHLWNRHFGRGIVMSVFDFGRKGAKPTHPELLDWLAVELMDNDWSMKHLHRLIVLSGTYRMTSSSAGADPRNLQSDVDNRFYWRRNPVRMEAQVVRDSLLSLAGQLDSTIGGPSIPVNDDASRRRSLYYVHSHNEHQPFLAMFDDAGVLECYRRAESIVPQQALALENSKLASDMAAEIAARLHSATNESDDAAFIRSAFETVLNVVPTDEELAVCLEALQELSPQNGQPASTAPSTTSSGVSVARVRLIQALLNHNDFITIR
jgi:mono/diheme cytochrome c family protein